jgi:GNAT superfamily N-acetyltransferase
MHDRADEPGRQVLEVQPGTAHFEQVLILAARVLAQDRYLASRMPHALESHVLAAFDGTRCAGFLRYVVQVIGAEEGRTAIMHNDKPLLEGYVEAFGVDPQRRRRGIGTVLQQDAARRCRTAGCYQMRSPQSGDKRRELCPEDCRRVRPASQQPKRFLLFPPAP